MPSEVLRAILKAVTGALLVALPAFAQDPIRILALRSDGKPLVAAQVTFVPGHRHGLPWPELDAAAQDAPALATTDAKGEARLQANRPGTLLVEHASGLCGVRFDVAVGTFVRIDVETGAEVRAAEADSELVLALALEAPDGRRTLVGTRSGKRLVLPAGRWHYLGTCGGRLCDGYVDLVAAQSANLRPPSAASEFMVRLPTGAATKDRTFAVRVPDWPVDLPASADGLVRLPGGRDVRRAILLERRTTITLFSELWLEASSARSVEAVPQDVELVPVQFATTTGGVRTATCVASLQRTGDRILPRSISLGDEHGRAWLARTPGAAGTRFCVVADGHAFAAGSLPADAPDLVVKLAKEHPLTVRIVRTGGEAAPGLHFVVRSDAEPWFVRRFVSGRNGATTIAGLSADPAHVELTEPGSVEVRENVPFPNGDAPREVVLQATSGTGLRGRVFTDDARPAVGIGVTVRDTTGALGFRERLVTTDAEGRFVFEALPDQLYTISASFERAGRTFSGQLRGVQPGADEWRLEVKCEDPVPPSRKDAR